VKASAASKRILETMTLKELVKIVLERWAWPRAHPRFEA